MRLLRCIAIKIAVLDLGDHLIKVSCSINIIINYKRKRGRDG